MSKSSDLESIEVMKERERYHREYIDVLTARISDLSSNEKKPTYMESEMKHEKNSATEQQLDELAQDLKNWMAMDELPNHYPQFSYATLKVMFWKRAERPGLQRISKKVGKKLFVNIPMFGLWMAGKLPEQDSDRKDEV